MIFNILILLSFAPMVVWHFQNLWRMEQYQFFPILLIAIAWLGWKRKVKLRFLLSRIPNSKLIVGVQLLGLLLYLAAVATETPNASYIALLIFVSSLIYEYNQNRQRSLTPLLLLACLLIRLPGVAYDELVGGLQLLSSQMSSWLLDTFRINHLLTGNIMRLPSTELFVDQACSGIVSLVSISAVGAVYAVWMRYGYIRGTVLIGLGVVWTMIMNVLRITSIAAAEAWYGIDLAHGWQHQTLGLVLFSVTVFGFYSTDQIIQTLLRFIDETSNDDIDYIYSDFQTPSYEDEQQVPDVPVAAPWANWSYSLVVACVIAVATVSLWGARRYALAGQVYTDANGVRLAAKVDLRTISPNYEVKEFQLVEREPTNPAGAFSNLFLVDGDNTPVDDYYFSVDYPYFGDWHELTVCYRAGGWKIDNRDVLTVTGYDDFVEVSMSQHGGAKSYFIFSIAEVNGNAVSSPNTNNYLEWMIVEARRRMLNGFTGEILQFQLWYPHETTEEQRQFLREQFLELRRLARQDIFPNSND